MADSTFRSLIPRAREIVRRVPRVVSVLLGSAAVVVGALLVARPLTSLTVLALLIACGCLVTGLGEVLAPRRAGWHAAVLAIGWIVVGVLVLVQMGVAIDLLPRFVAAVLVVSGIVRAVGVSRGALDDRLTAGLLGAADIVLGALAWLWPDVTLLIVAVLFGIRTVVAGVNLLWAARPGERAAREDSPLTDSPLSDSLQRTMLARAGRVLAAGLALVLAIGAASVSAHVRSSAPRTEDFYTAPGDVPAEPGKLLRAEPFERDMPAEARTWRILYTTTDAHGHPALASGLVLVPRQAPAGPRPVIAWAHGTTGFATGCAPTLLPQPLVAGAMPALPQLLAEGWALVATDYTGLGTAGPHPYLIGSGEATSVLDAVRAARQLPEIELDDRTVIWGHSQGGHAALWTGILAPSYAPDANIVAVASMAPASDAVGLVRHLPNVAGGSVFASYVIAAYTATYPDLRFGDYIIPAARTMVRDMSARCLAEPGVLVSVLNAMAIDRDRPIFAIDPLDGPFGDRLRENIPSGELTVPLLLAQGGADPLVTPDVQNNYASDRCAAGWNIDYRIYHGRDHLALVAADSPLIPELITWTRARFDGGPQTPNCPG